MPNTAKGFRYPAATDAPNGPLQIQNGLTDVDQFLYEHNWINFTPAGFGIVGASPGYMKDASGIVWLRGALTNNSSYAAPSGVIFTLPVGYRPAGDWVYPVYYDMANANYSAHLRITAAGQIWFEKMALSPPAGCVHYIFGSFPGDQ